MSQYYKPKAAGKVALPRTDKMRHKILETLWETSEIVGSTLGPFGRPVLLERAESTQKPIVTKDGVTVYKHMSFMDPVKQVVLEAATDATVRTAQEAGDGTTTATILSYAIAKSLDENTGGAGSYPTQRIVRIINGLVPDIQTRIYDRYAKKVDSSNYDTLLHKVATLSANGDTEIADIVMKSFDMVGEEGNIIGIEEYGNSKYTVEKMQGYTADVGYEDSCERYYQEFINDQANRRVYLENPIYLLFDGNIIDPSVLVAPLQKIYDWTLDAEGKAKTTKNIVIVAHSFSDQALAFLAYGFKQPEAFNAVPLKTPQTISSNSQSQFLHDLSAYTNSVVFNPLTKPLPQGTTEELVRGRSDAFESSRYRSTIIGLPDPTSVELRVDELKYLKTKQKGAEYDIKEIETRIAKLTCGVAKVYITAPSLVEIREKKDRVEDAWCAIRSASKYGTLPGGGWTLTKLAKDFLTEANSEQDGAKALAYRILATAFLAPVKKLYENAGYTSDEVKKRIDWLSNNEDKTFDLQRELEVSVEDILDSAPAVMEAIRNSISIATLLGTLGGVVVYSRNDAVDAAESNSHNRFQEMLAETEHAREIATGAD